VKAHLLLTSGFGGDVMSVERDGHDGIRLLNVREAARFLGTTPKTLYTMAWRRDIVFVKIGRSLRFDVKDLEQMIEKAKIRPSEKMNGNGVCGRKS
jgi:excisionase family DNA binding protein